MNIRLDLTKYLHNMDNLPGVLDYIRSFFGTPFIEAPRKRKAPDPLDHFLSPKCRRIQIAMPRDLDDYVEIKSPDTNHFSNKSKLTKFTSTPESQTQKPFTNGTSDDDDITFIKEIKSPKEKKTEASRKGMNYITPFTGRFLNMGLSQNGTRPKEKLTLLNNLSKKSNNVSRPAIGSSSLDYSIRLDDKLQYKKLLENASGSSSINDSSIYQTPVGRLLTYDTANRGAKILGMVKKSPVNNLNNSKERMSTKDRIIKILDDFENDPVVVKDSDSDSDVVFVTPPSPKPDIKVEPVNSLKKVIDTSKQTKTDWLQERVDCHRNYVAQRQKEIEELRECSEKHGKINKDMRWEILTKK